MLGLGHSLVGGTVLTAYNNTHAVSFDGSNDFIDTGASFQSTFRDSFSISFWMKSTANVNNNMFWGTQESGDEDAVFFYTRGSTRKISFNFFANNDKHREEADAVTFAAESSGGAGDGGTEGAWFHFVAVITKASSGDTGFSTVIYKDGSVLATTTAVGSVSDTNQAAYTNPHEVYIGGRNTDGSIGNPAKAIIDDWALWNVALDADAVSAIYNSGVPTDLLSNSGNYDNSGDLVAYYKLNEGSGTTATDATGGSDGTLTNGPSYVTDTPS